jgi:hypothetical protein
MLFSFALGLKNSDHGGWQSSDIESTTNTEWLFVGDYYAAPNFTNQGGAVMAGGVLNMLFRNYKIVPFG